MEKKLFDWKAAYVFDYDIKWYYHVILNRQIGPWLTGARFDSAQINSKNGTLKLYRNDELCDTFLLEYKVKDEG